MFAIPKHRCHCNRIRKWLFKWNIKRAYRPPYPRSTSSFLSTNNFSPIMIGFLTK